MLTRISRSRKICVGTQIKTAFDWYLKLQEEIFEVMAAQANINRDWNATTYEYVAEEVADVITVCISMLESLGVDEKGRSGI